MANLFKLLTPTPGDWFDLWHTHVDWRGEGNSDPEVRREFLRSLFAAWSTIEQLAASLTCPWQSWLVIVETNSSQDAVYLHTPNPNQDNFPYLFEDVIWGKIPPIWLAEFVTDGMEFGRSEFEGTALCWVRRTMKNT